MLLDRAFARRTAFAALAGVVAAYQTVVFQFDLMAALVISFYGTGFVIVIVYSDESVSKRERIYTLLVTSLEYVIVYGTCLYRYAYHWRSFVLYAILWISLVYSISHREAVIWYLNSLKSRRSIPATYSPVMSGAPAAPDPKLPLPPDAHLDVSMASINASLLEGVAEHCLDNLYSDVTISLNVKGAYKLTAIRKIGHEISHMTFDEPTNLSNYPRLLQEVKKGPVYVTHESFKTLFVV
jgi:hypothetical protein